MMNNTDKASSQHIQKPKKALVKSQASKWGIFALGHNDTQGINEETNHDFTLGI